MTTPPLLLGAIQFSVTCALLAPAVRPVGAPGAVPAIGEAVMVTLELAVLAGDELSVTISVAV